MKPRTRDAAALLAFAVIAVLTVWIVGRTQRSEVNVLDAVPADAFLVATVDIRALRDSPLGSAWASSPAGRVFGDRSLARTCGFDPLERMQEMAFAVPMEDDSGEFGVVIRADLGKDELLECAKKTLDARGLGQEMTTSPRGSFTLVAPQGSLAKRYPTFAYREGGPFLIARGRWLERLIDTFEGKVPNARSPSSKHAVIRGALAADEKGSARAAIKVSVLLPKEMRERIKRDMGDEVARQAGETGSAALMAGVLGVETAGVALAVGRAPGDDARAVVELGCENAAACAAVARVIDKTRRDWEESTALGPMGLAPLVQNLSIAPHGSGLRVTTHAPVEPLGRVIERLFSKGAVLPESSATATPPSAPSSDEIIGSDARPPTGLHSDAGAQAAPPLVPPSVPRLVLEGG